MTTVGTDPDRKVMAALHPVDGSCIHESETVGSYFNLIGDVFENCFDSMVVCDTVQEKCREGIVHNLPIHTYTVQIHGIQHSTIGWTEAIGEICPAVHKSSDTFYGT